MGVDSGVGKFENPFDRCDSGNAQKPFPPFCRLAHEEFRVHTVGDNMCSVRRYAKQIAQQYGFPGRQSDAGIDFPIRAPAQPRGIPA